MWCLRNEKENQLEAKMSDLEEKAKAGQQQKQIYEWKTTQLKDEYK
jgi:hypothetical protein